jgi:mono/diheme cytochrome c family protein
MKASPALRLIFTAALAIAGAQLPSVAFADESEKHGAEEGNGQKMLEQMQEIHREHPHEQAFEAMKEMEPQQLNQMLGFMRDIGVALPPMDAARGRELFVQKGCVVCHAVNGVGGEDGPTLNAADMPQPMNAFEFAARMWRGAAAMTAMQEIELGAVIELSGQDLADLVAFAHDAEEQSKLQADHVPEKFREMIEE